MKKLFIIIALISTPVWAAEKAPDQAKVFADINYRISKMEEDNRKLVGRLEELEYKLQQQEKKNQELQKKLLSSGQNEIVKQNNKYQQFVIQTSPTDPAQSAITVESDEELDQAIEDEVVKKEIAEKSEEENKNLSSDADFNKAFALLGQLEYDKSEKTFKDFIAAKPSSPMVGDAYYWLGEIRTLKQDFNGAAINYLKGYKNNKGGKKAPESMLKLAESLKELGKKDDACKNYARFAIEFPAAHQTLKQEAVAAQQELGCK